VQILGWGEPSTMLVPPVFFFGGEILLNFDVKNRILIYTKDFFMEKYDLNLLDFKEKISNLLDFYDKFQ
jgi:hypothetical protein